MLRYRFTVEVDPNDHYRGQMVDFPDLKTDWGKMNQVVTDLSLMLRMHFSELIRDGQPIPVFEVTERDARLIYLPAATSWRVLLWNLFVKRKMTLEDIARAPNAIKATPNGMAPIDYVRHVFDLRESSKYRNLIPFSRMLNVEMQAQVVPI